MSIFYYYLLARISTYNFIISFVFFNRPRLLPDNPKDGKKKTYLECNLGEVTLHHHVLHKESLPAGHLYTTAAGRQELCSTKNVPDLLDTLVPAKTRRISNTLPRLVKTIIINKLHF